MPGSKRFFSRSSSCCIARSRGSFPWEADSADALFVTVMVLNRAVKHSAAERTLVICNFLWTKFIIGHPFRYLRLRLTQVAGGWVGGRCLASDAGSRSR